MVIDKVINLVSQTNVKDLGLHDQSHGLADASTVLAVLESHKSLILKSINDKAPLEVQINPRTRHNKKQNHGHMFIDKYANLV
jgi:hypothetical protein